MIVSKGVILLAQTYTLNEDVLEWQRQSAEINTCERLNTFFKRSHREQRIAITAEIKRGCTVVVQNIYSVTPPPSEEHHKYIEYLHTIVQGTQTQIYEQEGLAQSNKVLASSN